MSAPTPAHRVLERTLPVAPPSWHQTPDVLVERLGSPDRWTLPTFLSADRSCRFRFSSPHPGEYCYSLLPHDPLAPGRTFVPEGAGSPATPAPLGHFTLSLPDPADPSPLYRHGPVSLDPATRRFRHHDGTPFFYLADSWWHGMSRRLDWPDGFHDLVHFRAAQGFSAVQFAPGLSCDIHPLDPRDHNEAGPAYLDPRFEQINPAFYDAVDRRVSLLCARGLMPCITGAWGYYAHFLGPQGLKRHWRHLLARYAAFPVTLILCGESRLTWYLDRARDDAHRGQLARDQVAVWSDVARYLRSANAFSRPLTVHPGPPVWGHDIPPLNDPALTDFTLLQPGHSDEDAVARSMSMRRAELAANPHKPVMIGECAWEGMHGASGPKTQRQLFWTQLLSGAPGHCYGSDSLWQMNSRRNGLFGPSPHGFTWGNAPWEDAMHWPGAAHVAIGKQILERFDWPALAPRPDWVHNPASDTNHLGLYAAGVPHAYRLIYCPRIVAPWSPPVTVTNLEPNPRYTAAWISPLDGSEHPIGPVTPDANNTWRAPHPPVLHDWILALRST